MIGSPLIKSTKKDKPGDADETKNTLSLIEKQGTDKGKVEADGQLIRKTDIKDASWADLFKGEEVGNAAQLDVGKVQMLYFTLVVFAVYTVSLGSYFLGTEGKLGEFPTVNSSMLALLGISHGGYLINKAVPHSKSDGQ